MERLAAALIGPGVTPVPRRSDAEIEETMATLALRYVVPADPGSIHAETVLAFRNTYAEERGQFQKSVREIVEQLAYLKDVQSEEEIVRHLDPEFKKTLKPRLERLRNNLKNS